MTLRDPAVWRKRYPNSLGQMAAIKREQGDTTARIQRAHSLAYQALEELRPLMQHSDHSQSGCDEVCQAWAHLVDSEGVLRDLITRS